mmetsp:Transcript_41334/g.47652  ORF Transcript_41334/g.47652 Transcript_41334/m.47652 type:complete len:103 (-) Transcript_41334:124-432(-)
MFAAKEDEEEDKEESTTPDKNVSHRKCIELLDDVKNYKGLKKIKQKKELKPEPATDSLINSIDLYTPKKKAFSFHQKMKGGGMAKKDSLTKKDEQSKHDMED